MLTAKPLLVGEAPSKNEPLPRPLEGRVGRRLAEYAGLTFEQYIERFDRVNLLDVRQDTKEKGFEFDMDAARLSARQLMTTIEPGRVVLLLGRRVAEAVGAVKNYFEPTRLVDGTTLYVLPHPSGVNRWWNEEANREQVRTFLRSILDADDQRLSAVSRMQDGVAPSDHSRRGVVGEGLPPERNGGANVLPSLSETAADGSGAGGENR